MDTLLAANPLIGGISRYFTARHARSLRWGSTPYVSTATQVYVTSTRESVTAGRSEGDMVGVTWYQSIAGRKWHRGHELPCRYIGQRTIVLACVGRTLSSGAYRRADEPPVDEQCKRCRKAFLAEQAAQPIAAGDGGKG